MTWLVKFRCVCGCGGIGPPATRAVPPSVTAAPRTEKDIAERIIVCWTNDRSKQTNKRRNRVVKVEGVQFLRIPNDKQKRRKIMTNVVVYQTTHLTSASHPQPTPPTSALVKHSSNGELLAVSKEGGGASLSYLCNFRQSGPAVVDQQ